MSLDEIRLKVPENECFTLEVNPHVTEGSVSAYADTVTWISAEQRAKAIATNTMYVARWVGKNFSSFNLWAAADLAALEAVTARAVTTT